MTNDEVILILKEWIKRDSEMQYADRLENIEIYNKVIKSLEAWKNVKEELENSRIGECLYDAGIHQALNVINKHLKEV